MYKLESTNYGYHAFFEGFMKRKEYEEWFKEAQRTVALQSGPFGVLVDLRGATAIPAEAQEIVFQGIQHFREKGMDRVAVVVANPIVKIQAVRFMKEVGLYPIARYIDASNEPNWDRVALDWITKGIDPD